MKRGWDRSQGRDRSRESGQEMGSEQKPGPGRSRGGAGAEMEIGMRRGWDRSQGRESGTGVRVETEAGMGIPEMHARISGSRHSEKSYQRPQQLWHFRIRKSSYRQIFVVANLRLLFFLRECSRMFKAPQAKQESG